MQFPLTEDMFRSLDLTKNIDRKFLNAFIQAVNLQYEKGRKAERGRFYVTADILKDIYKRFYNEDPEKESDIFFDVTAEYMNAALQQGLKDSEKMLDMKLEEIQIYPCFAEHPPKAEKIEQKEQYFTKTGLLQSQIILDSQGNLIDGYTSYLIAKAHDIRNVPVRYGKRQIVRASHKSRGKLYTWELPGILIDKVFVGDKVLVRTQRGIRTVTVAAVEEYAGQEQKPLRMVIKVKRKQEK